MAARGGSHRLSLSGSGGKRFRMGEEAYGGCGLLAYATKTPVRDMGSTAPELSTEDRDAGNAELMRATRVRRQRVVSGARRYLG